ncbi:hypothetical protein, partial [Novipirellula maiorica]|uniref:hypothetical protein n=1 Tax=Novipirellula maiorica TaxID=1265734 RepID=UPI001F410EAB
VHHGWFSGSRAGWIDLQRANLPARIGAITGDAIKVQLESTMGVPPLFRFDRSRCGRTDLGSAARFDPGID